MKKSYSHLKSKIQKLLGVAIQPHSVIDQIIYGTSEAIDEAYMEIEKNKTPHIYSGLTGNRIDGLGMLVGCPRFENEEDASYLARVMAHSHVNQASNIIAITMSLTNLKYTSHASFTPYTQGTGTSTIHFIPKDYEQVELAKKEIAERLKPVVSPDSYILIEPAKPVGVEIIAYCVFENDTEIIRGEIHDKLKNYINNIPIGETLSYGAINNLALNTEGVKFFNTLAIYIDGNRLHALEKIQTIEEKFLFQSISLEVSND